MNTDVNNHSAAFGWIGILAVVAFCTVWIACYLQATDWVWCKDVISNFGVSSNENVVKTFVAGMVIFGILLAIYGLGRALCGQKGYIVGGILFIITGFCVATVGLITCDVYHGQLHRFFAILTAVFIVFGMLAITIQHYKNGLVIPVGISLVFGIMAVACMVPYDFPTYETYDIIIGFIWFIMDGILMIAGVKGGKTQ